MKYFNKIEFWTATAILAFSLFFIIKPVQYDYNWTPNKIYFDKANISYNYYSNFILPKLFRYIGLYLSFLILNFYIIPKLVKKEAFAKSILIAAVIASLIGVVFAVTDMYLKEYLFFEYGDQAYTWFFQNNFLYAFWLILIFGFYTAIKYFGLYLLNKKNEIRNKYNFIPEGFIPTFIIWLIINFLFLIAEAEPFVFLSWILFSLSGIFLYLFAYNYLISKALLAKKPFIYYILTASAFSFISFLAATIILINIYEEEVALTLGFLIAIFHLFITAPLLWVIFKDKMEVDEEINKLDNSTEASDYLYIKSGYDQYKILPDEILYLEASGNYVTFVLKDKKVLSRSTFQEAINMLPKDTFVRVHRSYVININQIKKVEKNQVLVGVFQISVSNAYRQGLSAILYNG